MINPNAFETLTNQRRPMLMNRITDRSNDPP